MNAILKISKTSRSSLDIKPFLGQQNHEASGLSVLR